MTDISEPESQVSSNTRHSNLINALDAVHKSLLYSNLQFEVDKMQQTDNSDFSKAATLELHEKVSSDCCNCDSPPSPPLIDKQSLQKSDAGPIVETDNDSEPNLELQNQQNYECEKLSKKCKDGVCYCFSSDSDALSVQKVPIRMPNRIRRRCTSERFNANRSLLKNMSSKMPRRKSDSILLAPASIKRQHENNTAPQETNTDKPLKPLPTHCITIRAIVNNSTSARLSEPTHFNENNVEDVKQTSFSPITSSKHLIRSASVAEDHKMSNKKSFVHHTSQSNKNKCDRKTNQDKPMISISQEMNSKMVVVSKVEINRDKVIQWRQSETKKHHGTRKKRKKIIDDNFCNEILDEVFNLDTKVSPLKCQDEIINMEPNEHIHYRTKDISTDLDIDMGSLIESTDDTSQHMSTSPDFQFLSGKLEGVKKYSGSSVGRLMSKRLKISKRAKRNSADDSDYSTGLIKERDKGDTDISYLYRHSAGSESSDLHTNIRSIPPKKPPRTFSSNNSSKPSSQSSYKIKSHIGWIEELPDIKPTCPNIEDLDGHIGWALPATDRFGSNSFDPPENLLEMLNYDKHKSQMMQSKNSRAHPQVGFENIDTVDAAGSAPGFIGFKTNDTFTNSTPLLRSLNSTPATRSLNTTPRNPSKIVSTVADEELCVNCHKKKKSFRKGALKRAKSFFEQSKKSIPLKKLICRSKPLETDSPVVEDDDFYSTPQKSDITAQENVHYYESGKKLTKNLHLTPLQSNLENIEKNESPVYQKLPPPKPARRSLMKSSEFSADEKHESENNFDFNRVIHSPKKDRPLSTMRLSSFSLSPRKLFRSRSKDDETNAMGEEYYKSFTEDNEEVTILMSEFLKEMKQKVEESKWSEIDTISCPRLRRVSSSSEPLDPVTHRVQIDLHAEPNYSVIPGCSGAIPKTKSKTDIDIREITVKNRNLNSPSKYIMVNNDPNALYACVDKATKTLPKKSLSCGNFITKHQKMQSSPSYESLPDHTSALLSNINVEECVLRTKSPRLSDCRVVSSRVCTDDEDVNFEIFQEDFSITSKKNGEQLQSQQNSASYQNKTIGYDTFSQNLPEVERTTNASCTTMSTYDASKFLKNALGDDIQLLEETDVEAGTGYVKFDQDDGVDVIDSQRTPTKNGHVSKDTVDSPTRFDKVTSQNSSAQESPSVAGSSKNNGSLLVLHNLKEKLRGSLRRGKKYLKAESRRLSNMFEDTEEFRAKEKKQTEPGDAEKLYQSIRSDLSSRNTEPSDKYLLQLVNQITAQKLIAKQLQNAATICRNTKEFECSSELVEAERLLLLSTLKESAAKDELVRIDYTDFATLCGHNRNAGRLKITSVECSLQDEQCNTLFNYFYVCICRHKAEVKATLTKEKLGSVISFQDFVMDFCDLDPDYEIRLDIFVLSLRKNSRNYSHESKYHLNKDGRRSFLACPSPSKLSGSKLFSSSPILMTDTSPSQFKLHASVLISLDLQQPDKKRIQRILRNGSKLACVYETIKPFEVVFKHQQTNILNPVSIGLKREIHFTQNVVNGFLNVSEHSNGVQNWNRRWCQINGFVIQIWNYPQDSTEMVPLLVVDLRRCTTKAIELANRKDCARPRTFAIQLAIKTKTSRQIRDFLFMADNIKELNVWMKELNRVVQFIHEWHI